MDDPDVMEVCEPVSLDGAEMKDGSTMKKRFLTVCRIIFASWVDDGILPTQEARSSSNEG